MTAKHFKSTGYSNRLYEMPLDINVYNMDTHAFQYQYCLTVADD
jgi:hypothetical protein